MTAPARLRKAVHRERAQGNAPAEGVLPFRRPEEQKPALENGLAKMLRLNKKELATLIVKLRTQWRGDRTRTWRQFIRSLELRFVGLPDDDADD